MGNSESTLKTSAMHDQHAAAALAEAKRTNDLLANIMLLTAGTALLTAFLMLLHWYDIPFMANSTAAFRNGASMVYSASKQCITSAVAYAGEHILHMVGVCWFGLVSLRDLAKNLLRSLRTSERGTGTTTDAARQPSEAQKSGGETGHTSSHKAKKTRQLDGVLVGGSARQKAKKKEPGFVWI